MSPRRAGPFVLLFLACVAACAPVFVLPGWPENHDRVACFQRVEIFRRAFAEGSLLPLWTPLAENGHGSPFPFFYHRLFNTLAGGLALATGSTLAGVRAAILLLLFAGALGMRRTLRAAGLASFPATCGALLFVFSNYAYTDWVVRGAFAEFAAFMLVPWLFDAALGVVAGRSRAGWALGAVLALLFFAHSVIFLFASGFVLLAFAGALAFRQGRARALPALGQAALVVAVVAGPFLAGIRVFGADADLDVFRSGQFAVFRNFVPFADMLYDRVGGWTSSTAGYSVEIGRGFNSLAIVCCAAVAALAVCRRLPTSRLRETGPAWFLALGAAALYAVLESPVSAPLYRLAPPLQFVQFPWRLLTFSTAVSIVLLCLSIDLLAASSPSAAVRRGLHAALLAAVLFQVWYGVGRPPPPRLIAADEIAASLTPARLSATRHSDAFRPRGAPPPEPRPLFEPAGCVIREASPRAALSGLEDVPEIRLAVDSDPDAVLVINWFASPFLAVSAGRGGRVETTEGGTILVRPPPGPSEIVLRRCGLFEALRTRLFGR